jgi:phosphoribosylformylglycinamidine cyclo-ligase
VLPAGLAAEITADAWPLPPLFRWLMAAGHISAEEMTRTFNCGIGMVAIVRPQHAEAAQSLLAEQGETVWRLGTLTARDQGLPCCISNSWEEA